MISEKNPNKNGTEEAAKPQHSDFSSFLQNIKETEIRKRLEMLNERSETKLETFEIMREKISRYLKKQYQRVKEEKKHMENLLYKIYNDEFDSIFVKYQRKELNNCIIKSSNN